MASKKENLKSLFSNTRTRVIILFTALLMIFAVVVGYVKFKSASVTNISEAQLIGVGNIQSIPGTLNPTEQYSELQKEQNLTQAQRASQQGTSAIPTIIRTQALGEGVGVVGANEGQSSVGFKTLSQENILGEQQAEWLTKLSNGSCSKQVIEDVMADGANLLDIKKVCTCIQLKDVGLPLRDLESVCQCKELKAAGYNARDLKEIGYTAGRLRACGFDACSLKAAGFTAQQMKDGGFTDGELKGAGYSDLEISQASGLPAGMTAADILNAGCTVEALTKLRQAGVSADAIRRISGCKADQLKTAGYTVEQLRNAGFSAGELKNAGFTTEQLQAAGYSDEELLADTNVVDCSIESLKKAKTDGISASVIRQKLGCSAQSLRAAGYTAKELKDAGYTAAELKAAGFSPKDLKDAGFSAKELKNTGFTAAELKDAGFSVMELNDAGLSAKNLKDAGFSAAELKDAGFSAKELKDAGFSAKELKDAGFSAKELKDAEFGAKDLKDAGFSAKVLKDAGFSAKDLKDAGYNPKELNNAGFSADDLLNAGFSEAQLKGAGLVTKASLAQGQAAQETSSNQQLEAILAKQTQQIDEQKYQQKIQQRTSEMSSVANQMIQSWGSVAIQVLVESTEKESKAGGDALLGGTNGQVSAENLEVQTLNAAPQKALIKSGDVVFAVLDTSVNSDEPGPILATIVSGRLKGSKLIGSFNLPSNAQKMVITFNTMSVPGATKTTSISAYAIDPNTARTALSSRTNHHYLMRYGSLFAASFLQGFGNAFQSADTTVTIGGTGGGNNITVQNGIGRSTLQNAVIGLATVGKAWGQQAQQIFSTPITVEVYSGTGLGILFTQDVTTI